MGKQLSEGLSGFVHLVERQMLLHEQRHKLIRQHADDELQGPYHFITVSRDIGALGDAVASEIAARLRWKVFDKEIVDYIAKHSHISKDLVDQLDEKAQSLVHESVERWMLMFQMESYRNDEYHIALIKALVTLAAQGRSVLLGRGGAYVLQEQPGLHVRITASLPVRVRRLSKLWSTSIGETNKIVLKTDAERREFIQHHFKPDRDDNLFFHLIFNTDNLSVDYVAAAIVAVIEQSRRQVAESKPPVSEGLAFQNSERVSG
jgi:cytidylate kinase